MTRPPSLTGRIRWLAIAVVLTGSAACGSSRHASANQQQRAVLEFTNESMDKADVYAVVAGQAVRIGTVFAGRTERLVVPPDLAFRGSNVNVVARILARSNRPQSGPISIRPGDRLEVRLPVNLQTLVVLPSRP